LNATNDSVMWNKTAKAPFSPAVANGVVYVGNQAFNAITGAYIMSYNAGKVRFSSPAVAGDIIYFGSEDQSVPPVVGRPVGGSIYAFNVTSGSLLWSYEANETDGSSPVVANGLVYIGSSDGKLYAFGPALTSSPSPTSVVSVGSGSSNIAIEIAAISIIIIAAAAVGLVLRRQHQQREATFYKQNMPAHLTCSHRAFVFACALKTEKR
jgi:outer membrane protein assembly factor BamB